MSGERVEIRLDDKGGIDEICGDGVHVHIERMTGTSWFVILTRPDQTQEAFWLNGKKGCVEFTSHEHREAPETGPDSVPWSVDRFSAGYSAALKDAAGVARDWSRPDRMQLAAGEMSAPEIRSVKAVLGGIATAIEALPVKEG